MRTATGIRAKWQRADRPWIEVESFDHVVTDDSGAVRVLARQPIDMSKPHPFTEEGNTEFNMFLWMPPATMIVSSSR